MQNSLPAEDGETGRTPAPKIFYKAGLKYQLTREYRVLIPIYPRNNIATFFLFLTTGGLLTIRLAYAWDGPSGPTIDTPSAMRGSLIHDAIYQLIRLGLLDPAWRAVADAIYEAACVEDGMWRARAWAHFKALRAFGGAAAEADAERPELTAP